MNWNALFSSVLNNAAEAKRVFHLRLFFKQRLFICVCIVCIVCLGPLFCPPIVKVVVTLIAFGLVAFGYASNASSARRRIHDNNQN